VRRGKNAGKLLYNMGLLLVDLLIDNRGDKEKERQGIAAYRAAAGRILISKS
jgi:hypothetical protein